ncbi:MAG TPA: LysM domain-containing protein [Anaerolineaceae bacterium]|nr:LysM domain-containing protein [Anaerolineaceae bacterium]
MKRFAIAIVTATVIAGMLLTQVAVAAPSTGVSSVSWGGCGGRYMVHYGDYLARIAAQCGTSIGAILALNPQIYNPHWIYAGMVLNLGGGGGGYYGPQQGPVYNYAPRPKPAVYYNTNPWYGNYYSNSKWWNAGYYNPGQYYGGYYRYSYRPSVDLNTYSATAGQTITAEANGFPANVDLSIRIGLQGLGSYANYTGTTNSSGFYTMSVPIPDIAQHCQYWYVQVVGGGVQKFSQLIFITK